MNMPAAPVSVLRLNPYRLFFPLGILFGVVGVGEWLVWSLGTAIPAAGLQHASLQAQGFLTCFAVGFLMTAFPRFTGASPASVGEIVVSFGLAVALLAAFLARHFMAGQALFGALIVSLIVFAGRRLPKKTKPLPPPFLLMGFGFLHALTGTTLMLASGMGAENVAWFAIGRQMVQVGFLLCLVLGITGQLAPFLMGYTADPGCDDGPAAKFRSGGTAMVLHGIAGALIFGSFWLIPTHERAAYAIRAVVATAHLLTYARIARPIKKKTALIYFFTLSLWMIPAGLVAAAVFPAYRVAALHLVFVGGFSLMIFSFGQLVVLSHSGQAQLLNGRLIPLKIVGVFVLLSLATRVSADIWPNLYIPLIHSASGFWVLGAAVWLIHLIPRMFGRPSGDH